MAILEFDQKATEKLLAIYTTTDIIQQRRDILDRLTFKEGDKVLDVGSGPGFMVRDIAEEVGVRGTVSGVDISKPLLEMAKDHNRDLSNVEFKFGKAERLEFSNNTFDFLICTQVLEYVDHVDEVLVEFNRVLKKGGTLVILDTDWDSIVWNSSDRNRMNRILEAWENHLTDPFLPRTLVSRMEKSDFRIDHSGIIPLLNNTFEENTYSNLMIDMIVDFVIKNGYIETEEVELWKQDLRSDGLKEKYFFSLNRYLFVGTKN